MPDYDADLIYLYFVHRVFKLLTTPKPLKPVNLKNFSNDGDDDLLSLWVCVIIY